MQIDVITIFPEMFPPVLGASILKRAQARGRLTVRVHDLRDFTHDKRRTVDDRPYGGGPGMVMRVEPLVEAVEALRRGCGHSSGARHLGTRPVSGTSLCRSDREEPDTGCETILLSPAGERLTTAVAQALAERHHLILICGHYEGVDARVRLAVADRELSIGDYVLTGGELPAMVLVDSLARFLPNVIGHAEATAEESFAEGLLEYPHYTRPPVFRGMAVPDVLLSGDHERIAAWRKLQSVARTFGSRPDLVTKRSGPRAQGPGQFPAAPSPEPRANSVLENG